MYEAIRQYTAAHIAHAPSRNQAAQARHAAYFTRLVARQEPARIRLTETASRLALLDELHNLRAAHASLLSSDSTNGDADDSNLPIAVELGLAIHELLKTSLPSLAIETVSRTLLRTITPKREAEQTQLRVARAEAYLLTGQYPRAAQDLELAKPLVTSDTETGCRWLHQHAMVMFRLGRCCRAQKELVLALKKATSIGFELEARIRRDLGYVRCEAFRDRDGLRQLDRAAELFAAHGNAIGEARALTYGAMYRNPAVWNFKRRWYSGSRKHRPKNEMPLDRGNGSSCARLSRPRRQRPRPRTVVLRGRPKNRASVRHSSQPSSRLRISLACFSKRRMIHRVRGRSTRKRSNTLYA